VTGGPSPAAALRVSDLVVRYGTWVVVDCVSFDVMRGEVFGLLGRNGAAETSTLSAIEGLLRSGGSVLVDGIDGRRDPLEAR